MFCRLLNCSKVSLVQSKHFTKCNSLEYRRGFSTSMTLFKLNSRETGFTDYKYVVAKSGKGGDGSSSLKSVKYIEFAGPDGGDGGNGGSVTIICNRDLQDLSHIKTINTANAGRSGQPNCGRGKDGDNKIIEVPLGTCLWNSFETQILYDFLNDDDSYTLAIGGRGGLGNINFKTSTNRAPQTFTYGEPETENSYFLELKSIADVGMVGFPNAGKSSFLKAVSKAHPKIAAYPFTTLNPYIGNVDFPDFYRFTLADIPGIINDAHKNIGLGFRFLRHIERCGVVVYIIDTAGVDGRDPVQDLADLQVELLLYNPDILDKPSIVIANKLDLESSHKNLQRLIDSTKIQVVPVSAQEPDKNPTYCVSNATKIIRERLEQTGLTLNTMNYFREEKLATSANAKELVQEKKSSIDYSKF